MTVPEAVKILSVILVFSHGSGSDPLGIAIISREKGWDPNPGP